MARRRLPNDWHDIFIDRLLAEFHDERSENCRDLVLTTLCNWTLRILPSDIHEPSITIVLPRRKVM
jgi:hypothetical protein